MIAPALGWLADHVVGEPPARWHPVVWFGRAMSAIEQRTYRPTRWAGVVHLTVGAGIGAATGLALQRLVGRSAATAIATYVSVAGRMLADEATATFDLLQRGDLAGARQRVRSLVGRDTDELGAVELVRATIESLAENTVDAVVAPLCWATVAGAPGVLAHRAINTLDAMIGHRSARYERFGWASARADDVANYVPARLAVLATLVLRPRRAGLILGTVRRDAGAHPSPNGGVIEAAVAAVLGVQLGGTNRYQGEVDQRGLLGDGTEPLVADGRAAIGLTTSIGVIVAASVLINRPLRRWQPLTGGYRRQQFP